MLIKVATAECVGLRAKGLKSSLRGAKRRSNPFLFLA
jgi:hypothetical protein